MEEPTEPAANEDRLTYEQIKEILQEMYEEDMGCLNFED